MSVYFDSEENLFSLFHEQQGDQVDSTPYVINSSQLKDKNETNQEADFSSNMNEIGHKEKHKQSNADEYTRRDEIIDIDLKCNSIELDIELNEIYLTNAALLEHDSHKHVDSNDILVNKKQIQTDLYVSKIYYRENIDDDLIESCDKIVANEETHHLKSSSNDFERDCESNPQDSFHSVDNFEIKIINKQEKKVEQELEEVLKDHNNSKPEKDNSILSNETDITILSSSESINSPRESFSYFADISCPFYQIASNYAANIRKHSAINDLLLWKNRKSSLSIFIIVLIMLFSLSLFSFLSVISSLALIVLTIFGSFRLFSCIISKLIDLDDSTFDSISELEFSMTEENLRKIFQMFEPKKLNKILNQIKSIIIWDNVFQSGVVYTIFYIIYSIGSVMNALTLVQLAWISLFTIPKLYQIYKISINCAIEHAYYQIGELFKQFIQKIPYLHRNQ